jgi:vanillate O-demethylase ferredoxin subunit
MSSRPPAPELIYEHHVFCCMNERPAGHPRGCCAARGSIELRGYMKARAKELGLPKVRINASGCLERCELGPTMVIYPEAVWYSYDSKEDVDEILERHLLRGERVERLLLDPDQTLPRPKEKRTLALKVTAVKPLTAEIKMIELADPEGAELPAFEAGAHIDVFTGNGLRRSYSLANDPKERHRYVIGVLRETDSRGGSTWIDDKVKTGDSLMVTPPLNDFGLEESASEHVMIAGGIGITPLLSMGHRLRELGAKVTLHYCTKSPAETAFAEEVKAVFADDVVFHHDDGDPSRGIELAKVLADPPAGAVLYLCGPLGLMDAAREAAARWWPEDSVLYELFKPSTKANQWVNEPFEIYLSRHKRALTVPADKTILDVVRDDGIDLDSSCEDGLCSTCRVRLLGGQAEHRDSALSAKEKASNGWIITCSSRAKPGETLILDL